MPMTARFFRYFCPLAVFLTALLSCSASVSAADWHWSGVERVVAISDVHGAYPAMVRTLQRAALLDEHEAWSGGRAHLVVAGDIVDRGPDSRRVMDLLMRLEGEAAAAGGMVHVLLGNHEVMNLVGDLRYVSDAEYAAFADEESAARREQAFAVFKASHPGETDEAILEVAFARRAPRGFFAHRRVFAPDGRYGKWLLEKPFIVVINDTAFVHGGLSPLVTQVGLEGVNGEMKAGLAAYAGHLRTLIQAGLLDATEEFYLHADRLRALPADPERPSEIKIAIAGAIELHAAGIHAIDSPIWYRGNVACSPLIESDKLDAALARIGAARVVIGHTPTATGNVQTRLGGRVIEIDTGMLTSAYGGSGHALIIEDGRLSVAEEKTGRTGSPVPQPRYTGTALSASELEQLLATGNIRPTNVQGVGPTSVEIQKGETRVAARVPEGSAGRDVFPEIAAYRLDRLLGLGMVPVTVSRQVDGKPGYVQFAPAPVENEAERRASGAGYGAWCPLAEQWQALYVFDALIGNDARFPQHMLYNPNGWRLVLIGHQDAFGTGGRPDYLKRVDLHLGPAWVAALTSLTDDVLQEHLGDVLDRRSLRALATRRDELLREAAR